jgi:hypothetical protein
MRAVFLFAIVFVLFFALNVVSSWRNIKQITAIEGAAISTQYDALKAFAESVAYANSSFIVNFDNPLSQNIAEYYFLWGRTYRNRISAAGDIYVAGSASGKSINIAGAEVIFENCIYKIFRLSEK